MRASKNGIEVTKPELTALLTFAGTKEGTDGIYFGIRRPRGPLVANATDGKRALEITTESDSDNHVVGEWHVARAFLEGCSKILDAEGICILLVTSSGLRKARIMDVESLAERATVSWHEEAASTQITMDSLSQLITQAQLLASHRGSWFALQGRYLAEMLCVSRACNKAPISLYPPPDALSPMYFEATSDSSRWRGVIMPVRVREPGGALDDEDDGHFDESTEGDAGSVNAAVGAFKRTLEEHGATVTMHAQVGADGPPLKTEKKPKAPKKGSKK